VRDNYHVATAAGRHGVKVSTLSVWQKGDGHHVIEYFCVRVVGKGKGQGEGCGGGEEPAVSIVALALSIS